MPRLQKPHQALKQLATTHLSPGALVQYHDGTIDDGTLRLHIDLHLELCSACRQRLAAVNLLHLSEEELMDYHDYQVHNSRTLARIQAHLEEQHCESCSIWLEEFRQAETMAAEWLTAQRPVAAAARQQVTPEPREPSRQTPGARLAAARKRLQEALVPLFLPAGFGQRLVPQYAHYASQHAAIDGEPVPGLWVLVEPLDGEGQRLILSSEQAEYAGRLLMLVYTAQETGQILLQAFSVLPAMPDDETYCYEAVVRIPSETMASWTDVQLAVYPIEPADLDEDAVPILAWSIRQAADEVSQEAWRSLCQRLQQHDQGHAVVRAWHAAQLDAPERGA